jgi:NADP-dependent 3-hydroxy acid dehydrogenase YdfG
MSNNIEGKVVVITGASSGLGEATARLLSAQGASVVLGARRTGRIQALADELTGSGGKALAIPKDVTHYDQVKRLVDAAVQTYGRIDVMLNNTPGISSMSPRWPAIRCAPPARSMRRPSMPCWPSPKGCERRVKPYNIRTTVISPGAVATELLDSITEPDIAENVRKSYEMAIPADSFARAVAFAIGQPEKVDVNEILLRPTRQEF